VGGDFRDRVFVLDVVQPPLCVYFEEVEGVVSQEGGFACAYDGYVEECLPGQVCVTAAGIGELGNRGIGDRKGV
jgi:hypothetical protein